MTRWCQVTPDAVANWLAADVVDQGAFGRSAEEAFGLPVKSDYASIPATAWPRTTSFAEGDRVVARVTSYETHTGECMGIGPADSEIKVHGTEIMRSTDGGVVEQQSVTGIAELLAQLRVN